MAATDKEDTKKNGGIEFLNDNVSTDEWDARKEVYFNDVIMRKVISFVSDIKDRQNLELSGTFMNYLSSRVPYISYNNDNSIMDMYFQGVQRVKHVMNISEPVRKIIEPLMNINVAGNNFKVEVLTDCVYSTYENEPNSQPTACILKIKHIITRFSRQIRRLHIGSISEIERRLGCMPDHQLILTRDLCEEFDQLNNVDSLVLRDLCLMSPAIEYWSGTDCVLTNRISSLCFHGICSPDDEGDEKFVLIISRSITKLHLSNCAGEKMMKIWRRLRTNPNKLDILYIAINYFTFETINEVHRMFREASNLANKLHICACFPRFICHPLYLFQILVSIFALLPEIQQITEMDLDLSPLMMDLIAYNQFFTGLPQMTQLRVLRLLGFPINYDNVDLWNIMLESVSQLSQITEFSVIDLLKHMRIIELEDFCKSLPANLSTLVLHNARQLQDNHFSLIAQRCPRLDTLYIRDLRSVTPEGIVRALLEFRMLTKIALCHSGPVTNEAYELLANSEVMPHIEAVIVGGDDSHQEDVVPDAVLRRLPHFRVVTASDREYHLWNSRKAYEELLAAARYPYCPGCGREMSLSDQPKMEYD